MKPKRTQRMKQIRSITPMMHSGSDALNVSITLLRVRRHLRATLPTCNWSSYEKMKRRAAGSRQKKHNRGDWRRLLWRGGRYVQC